jgi:hypothetical protein
MVWPAEGSYMFRLQLYSRLCVHFLDDEDADRSDSKVAQAFRLTQSF